MFIPLCLCSLDCTFEKTTYIYSVNTKKSNIIFFILATLGEHWIGNENIHILTNQKNYQLKIELTDWARQKVVAVYDYFMIAHESDGYRLNILGYNGNAGDGMSKHNGMKFSTFDVDNDLAKEHFDGNCAKRFSGAWWYYKCYKSNLTGKYYRNGNVNEGMHNGISWKPWRPSNYSLKAVAMRIKPLIKL